ncbi:MAG: hypothetical protein ABEK01_05710 [Candidatus Nanohaloarchaea archaeon]
MAEAESCEPGRTYPVHLYDGDHVTAEFTVHALETGGLPLDEELREKRRDARDLFDYLLEYREGSVPRMPEEYSDPADAGELAELASGDLDPEIHDVTTPEIYHSVMYALEEIAEEAGAAEQLLEPGLEAAVRDHLSQD